MGGRLTLYIDPKKLRVKSRKLLKVTITISKRTKKESWKPAGFKTLYRHYPQTGESHTATQLASSLDASTKSPDVAKFLNPSSFKLANSVCLFLCDTFRFSSRLLLPVFYLSRISDSFLAFLLQLRRPFRGRDGSNGYCSSVGISREFALENSLISRSEGCHERLCAAVWFDACIFPCLQLS